MSSRSYLSIGDVLTLLRQEFPDVTISKIRFLESQGLVNPERTPSGYRKFYEQDVERLRWVLRQQREHFLPLKVIKGRLEAEGDALDDDFDDGFEPLDDLDQDPVGTDLDEADSTTAYGDDHGAVDRARRPEPVLVGHRGTGTGRVVGPDPGETADSADPAPGGSLPGFGTPPAPPAPVGAAEMTAATFTDPPEADPDKATAPVAASTARRSGTSRPAAGRGTKAAAPAGAKAAGEPAPVASSTAAPAPGGAGAAAPVSTMAGTAMTVEELASAAGLTVGDVQQLVSFGLLTGRLVGGVAYYDDDALTVARAAAGFARFGVEARHLRLHKLAAEREAGFIEQIVLPLLKQRNPESRQKALDNVTELSRLGQQLRSTLLRNALRDQLGG